MRTLLNPDDEQFRSFFKDCDIVMSAPNVAFFVGEHAVLRGTPSVVQALPTRVYVGIKRRGDTEEWLTSKASGGGGELHDVRTGDDPNLVGIKHVKSFVQVYPYKTNSKGQMAGQIDNLAIRVLSDITPGSGADWSGAFSSALAGCVHFGIVENQRNSDSIRMALKKWKDGDDWRSYSKLNDINLLAFFLESAFHDGKASGYGTIVSLLGPVTPVIYRTRRRFRNKLPYIDVYTSVEPLDADTGTKEVISRLREITDSVQLAPLASSYLHLMYVAVIDTGTRKVMGTSGAIKRALDDLLDDVEEAAKQVPKTHKLPDFDSSYQLDDIWAALDYYVMAFIHFFQLSLMKGTDYHPKAIRYMDAVGNMLLSLGLGWKELAAIKTKVFSAKGVDQTNTVVKLSGGGMAGVCTLLSTKLDHRALSCIVPKERILYSSDLLPHIDGLRLHKRGEDYV